MKALAQYKIVNQEQINKGMKRARREAAQGERYLPSGPMFASWCKPSAEELGIKSFESCYSLIQSRSWEALHPAFYHVATKTEKVRVIVKKVIGHRDVTKEQRRLVYDLSLLATGKEYESRRVAKEIYDEVIKRVRAGESFEEPKFIEGSTDECREEPLMYYDPNGPKGNEAMSILLGSMRGKHA